MDQSINTGGGGHCQPPVRNQNSFFFKETEKDVFWWKRNMFTWTYILDYFLDLLLCISKNDKKNQKSTKKSYGEGGGEFTDRCKVLTEGGDV